MQKIILIIACLCRVLVIIAQPNINRAEYFFNTDPGFGNGTPIPVPSPAPSLNISFGAKLTGIPEGINNLFIRSCDVNGKWSITNRFLFVKSNNLAAAPNINRVEYFINTDPGFGNGTAINVTSSPDIINASGSINLTSAPEGVNSLFIRSRDINGQWSITNRFLFVHSNTSATNKITNAEYFIDTDPGFGKASKIPVAAPGPDLPVISFNADIDSLSEGVHSLFIRSLDSTGNWSVTNRFLFVKAARPPLPDITSAEYFIDKDPGFGKAVPVALNPATDQPNFIMDVNITGLSAGVHRLYLRSRDKSGKWSITNNYAFPITTLVPAPLIVINSLNQKKLCGSNQFNDAYHATGIYNMDNTFSVQLSNATGNFATPQVIGTLTDTVSGLINCTIPLSISNGTNYKIRVVSSSPVVTGLASDTLFTLFKQPRFSDTLAPIVCMGETINLDTVFNTSGFTTVWNTPNPAAAFPGTYQLITSNTAFCRDTAVITVRQDTARWMGTVSSDWHNPANWNIKRVPTIKTHVTIPGNTPNACIISTANAQAASIRAQNGANVQTINNKILQVTGQCTPSTLPPN